MDTYLNIIKDSFSGYSNYLVSEILNPHWGNYFYWLIGISLVFWILEVVMPWRKNQNKIRKGETGRVHLHLVNVGMVNLVAEADGRRLEGILIRQVYLDLP